MKAYIRVLENPYFATPKADGRFAIHDVPAGVYLVKAWHPTEGERVQSISIPETGEMRVHFAF